MKKLHNFRETDESHRCRDCNQPLKENLLEKNPNAKRCWTCFKLHSNTMSVDKIKLREKQRANRVTFNYVPFVK